MVVDKAIIKPLVKKSIKHATKPKKRNKWAKNKRSRKLAYILAVLFVQPSLHLDLEIVSRLFKVDQAN
jgi:hypothetical protein